jgi:hypothetical protein
MVDIDQVGTSCGFSVPTYDFTGYRSTLHDFFEKRVAAEERGDRKDGIERYWAYKNAWSMDGLAGLVRGVETGRREGVVPIGKMVGRGRGNNRGGGRTFGVGEVVLLVVLSWVVMGVGMVVLLRYIGAEGLVGRLEWLDRGISRSWMGIDHRL